MLITPTHGLLTGYTAVAFLILILLVTFSLAVQVHVVLDFFLCSIYTIFLCLPPVLPAHSILKPNHF